MSMTRYALKSIYDLLAYELFESFDEDSSGRSTHLAFNLREASKEACSLFVCATAQHT
jgi:hypothetical protein